MVILYHLHVPQFEGGFIGVTVFFALSGFLITTLCCSASTGGPAASVSGPSG